MAQSILVVDDEKAIRKTLSEILSFEGFIVDEAADGAEAIKKIKENNYDCILCDVKMPKMDGFDLYQEIKKIDSQVKICFLTASEMYYEEFRKEAYCSLDKDMSLRKPIENEDLLEKINMIIRSNLSLVFTRI